MTRARLHVLTARRCSAVSAAMAAAACGGSWGASIVRASVHRGATCQIPAAAAPPPAAVQHRDTRHLGQQPYGDQQGYRKKKKESFLSDLFDF